MKTGKADITIVLDRSGSMGSVVTDTIGGFNAFVDAQKALPGEAALSLVQFDDQYEVVHSGKAIADVPALTTQTFQPRGSTALLDAIGRTIHETGARFAAMPDGERPERIVIAIITDGFENASRSFNRAQIHQMIGHQRDAYKWEFLFIGANQDAIAEGGRINIPSAAALTYDHSNAQAAFAAAASSVASYRSTGTSASLNFTDEQRKKASTAKH